jgi:hypothetical protein
MLVCGLGICGCDQYQLVAEQVDAGIRLDELPFADVIHPLEVRRNKHIGRRALFDLFGERRACGVAHGYLDACCLCECSICVVERILQRCGREDGDLLLGGR